MRGLTNLILIQALFSTISGVLMANMSLIGRLGVWFIYRDYGVLRVWWKTALILLGIQLLLIFILWLGRQLLPAWGSRLFAGIFFIVGLVGVYFTYIDFTTTSHRLLKSDFHLGGYLVWLAWAISCIWFMVSPARKSPAPLSN